MMKNIVNRFKCIEVQTVYINLLKEMFEEEKYIFDVMEIHFEKAMVKLTNREEYDFQKAVKCHLCDFMIRNENRHDES